MLEFSVAFMLIMAITLRSPVGLIRFAFSGVCRELFGILGKGEMIGELILKIFAWSYLDFDVAIGE